MPRKTRELTPQEQALELHQEFMVESACYKLEPDPLRKLGSLVLLDSILDAYLDLWPQLMQ